MRCVNLFNTKWNNQGNRYHMSKLTKTVPQPREFTKKLISTKYNLQKEKVQICSSAKLDVTGCNNHLHMKERVLIRTRRLEATKFRNRHLKKKEAN